MSRERAVWVVAGFMVLLSQALAYWVSGWWHLLGIFVGVNLIQGAFTGFCPAEFIFGKLGFASGSCTPRRSLEGGA